MVPLNKLGKRICIIGCSNSGKSTLAENLSHKLNIPVYHLDQYAHIPNSNWQRQSDEIFIKAHNEIISQDSWIIEGNYKICMKSRFNIASSVIWLDLSIYGSFLRYMLRVFKNDPNRPGRLKGSKKEFSFQLVKQIIFNYPKNRIIYESLIEEYPNLLLLYLHSMKELKRYYDFWEL